MGGSLTSQLQRTVENERSAVWTAIVQERVDNIMDPCGIQRTTQKWTDDVANDPNQMTVVHYQNSSVARKGGDPSCIYCICLPCLVLNLVYMFIVCWFAPCFVSYFYRYPSAEMTLKAEIEMEKLPPNPFSEQNATLLASLAAQLQSKGLNPDHSTYLAALLIRSGVKSTDDSKRITKERLLQLGITRAIWVRAFDQLRQEQV